MLPILCVMDVFAFWVYRRDWSRTHVRALLPAAIIGIALGAWAFHRVAAGRCALKSDVRSKTSRARNRARCATHRRSATH